MKSVFILLGLSFLMNAPQMDAVKLNFELIRHVSRSKSSLGASIPVKEVIVQSCQPPATIISFIGCVYPVKDLKDWDDASSNCRGVIIPPFFPLSWLLSYVPSVRLPELQSAFKTYFDVETSVWVGPKYGDQCPYIDMAPTPPVIKNASCTNSYASLCLYATGSTADSSA